MKTLLGVLFAAMIFHAPAQAQTCSTPAQLDTDLTNATQAQTISLSGVNPVNCPEVSMSQSWTGGKYVFSDSP